MRKTFLLFFIILHSLLSYSQEYRTIEFDTNGKIEIPKNWKIYTARESETISNLNETKHSNSEYIVKASDLDNSTIYLNLVKGYTNTVITEKKLKSPKTIEFYKNQIKQAKKASKKNTIIKKIISPQVVHLGNLPAIKMGMVYYNKITDVASRTINYDIFKGKTQFSLMISCDPNNYDKAGPIIKNILNKIKFK